MRAVCPLLAVLVTASACGDGFRILDGYDTTRITRLGEGPVTAFRAAPDGSLFATVDGHLFRAAPADSPRWDAVAQLPFHAIEMHPASAQNVLFLPQLSVEIWEWEEGDGLAAWETPLSDSLIQDGHHTMRIPLVDIAGDGRHDVVAVGDRAAIVGSRENGWELEPNPLVAISRLPAPEWFASALWEVDSFGGRFYAANSSHLLTREQGTWRSMQLPEAADPTRPMEGIAATPDGVVVSFAGLDGRPRLFRFDGSRWIDLTSKVRSVEGSLVRGRAQADGSALLWSLSRYVVEVRGADVRVFRVAALGAIRGAARSGADLYAGGTHEGQTGIVVRLTR